MAAISGNVVTLALAKQSAKGTAATTPTYKLKLTGGDIGPARDVIQLQETDASRQQGASIVVSAHVEGSPEFYVRPDDFGLLAYLSLGASADAGSTNFTHTATPANSGPYFTMWKAIGGSVLVDKYVDCRVTAMRLRGAAGGVLTVGIDVYGLSYVLGATDPVMAPVTQTPLVWPQTTVTLGGADPGTVESWELNITNNGQALIGDGALTPYEYVWGELAVDGTLTLLFESDAKYRAFHTGSTSGTTPSQTLYAEAMTVTSTVNANLSVAAVLNSVAYTSVTVPPDPGGAPIRSVLGFRSMPDASIANYISLVTKNAVASY